jgi:hypothetical protein
MDNDENEQPQEHAVPQKPVAPFTPASSFGETVVVDQNGNVVSSYTKKENDSFAIASLVLGIIPCGAIFWILGIIFGFIALNRIKHSGGTKGGKGLAIAGIICGIAYLVIVFIVVTIFIILGATGHLDDNTTSMSFLSLVSH